MAGGMGIKVTVKKSPINYSLYKDIQNSIESSPQLRKEIRRVFQVANRRIQNIESSGLLSPAVLAANKTGKGYSKFSISAQGSWQQVKEEYSRCVAFLNAQTSTATGARRYKKALQSRMGLSDEPAFFESLYKDMTNTISKGQASDLAYWDSDQTMSAIYSYVDKVRNSIEAQAKVQEATIQAQIDTAAQVFYNTIESGVDMLGDSFNPTVG